MTPLAQPHLHSQLARFLRAVALTAAAFAGFELAAGALVSAPALVAVGASMAVFALTLYGARRTLERGRAERAGGLAALSFLLAGAGLVAAMPGLLPVGVFFVVAACSLPLVFRSQRLYLVTAAASVATAVLLVLISLAPPLFAAPAPWIVAALTLSGVPACAALMGLLFYTIWQSFTASLGAAEGANAELRALQGRLAAEVAERTAALALALADVEARAAAQAALLAENQRQGELIRGLSVPVLPIGAGTLVMPLVGALDAERLEALLQRALAAIAAGPTRMVVLDITGVPMIDERVAQGLMRVPQAARLLGAEVMLVGVTPEVAQTVIGLGLNLGGLRTASTLAEAIAARSLARA